MSQNNDCETNSIWADSFLSLIIGKAKKYRYVIFSCLFFGFLTYMFAFTNKLVNWDELTFIFSKGATIESGRWGLELLSYVIPNYSMPWLFGCMTLACMTVSVCLIVKTFSIKSRALQIVLSGLIIAFPSLFATFSYMFTSSSYGVAFLLAILALALFARPERHWHIVAVLCTVLSVSIYQSYVMVLSSLLIVLLIQRLMYRDASAKQVFRQGLSFLAYLGLSMVIYFVLTMAINLLTGIPMGRYAKHAMDTPSPVLDRINDAYISFFKVFSQNEKGLVSPGISQYSHILMISFIVIECVIWAVRKKNLAKGALLALMLVMMPVSVFGMYLAISIWSVHTLVMYSFIAVYVLAVIIIDSGTWMADMSAILRKGRTVVANVVIFGMLVIVCCNVSLANEAYLKMHLSHQNMISFSTSLIAELNAIPEYKQSTPVAFVGEYDAPDFYDNFSNLENIMGFPTMYPNQKTIRTYCGYDIAMATEEEVEALKELPEVQNMPIYPNHGCIQMVNDTVVVKFSN